MDGALVFEAVIGGVLFRIASIREIAELRVLNDGGSTCGISLWNSSERRRCVKVLFACSSADHVSVSAGTTTTECVQVDGRTGEGYSSGSVAPLAGCALVLTETTVIG